MTPGAASEDPAHDLAMMRAQGKPPVVWRKLRELVQGDVDADLSALPANVSIEPGALTVRFGTVEELAFSLCRLAVLLDDDLVGFAARYEPVVEIDVNEALEREAERADAASIREFLAAHG
jgi:hypothetical protein